MVFLLETFTKLVSFIAGCHVFSHHLISLAFNHLCFFIVLIAAFTLFAGHVTGRRAVVRHVITMRTKLSTDDIFLTEETIGFLVLIFNLFAKPSDGCVALLIFLSLTAPLLMFVSLKGTMIGLVTGAI